MFINEVEHIVGLSKKSIRYYEENGLLTPKRNHENGYRIYTEEDIQILRTIKFLRELDVPIRDLKRLHDKTLTLQDCMKERIKKIETEEKKYQKIKELCLKIISSNETYQNIDITEYFQEVNRLNKEGFTMRNVKMSKKRKILGAILSSFLFSLLFIFISGMITYFQFIEEEKIPWILYMFIMVILVFLIVGIIYNLIVRIKEIKGGEEDEASKY